MVGNYSVLDNHNGKNIIGPNQYHGASISSQAKSQSYLSIILSQNCSEHCSQHCSQRECGWILFYIGILKIVWNFSKHSSLSPSFVQQQPTLSFAISPKTLLTPSVQNYSVLDNQNGKTSSSSTIHLWDKAVARMDNAYYLNTTINCSQHEWLEIIL